MPTCQINFPERVANSDSDVGLDARLQFPFDGSEFIIRDQYVVDALPNTVPGIIHDFFSPFSWISFS